MKRASKSATNSEPAFKIEVPATSANLGPGFDAIALAMNLSLRVTARRSSAFAVEAHGRDTNICGALRKNLIISVYRDTLRRMRIVTAPIRLTVDNSIPIGKGCGSSAAARVAGLLLANHFGKLRLQKQQILQKAAQLEGHADNAAACCLGGVVIVAGNADGYVASRLHKLADWQLLLVIPRDSLATGTARSVLPAAYDRADVVDTIQNSMLLVQALQTGDATLLSIAMRDTIHEPYRQKLCPLLPCLKPLSGTNGVLGAALSGAGPSMILFVDPKGRRAISAVRSRLREFSLEAEVLEARIGEGVRIQTAARRLV